MGKMVTLEQIYDISPIWIQNLMCTMKGVMNYRGRYGKSYQEYRKFFSEFDKLTLDDQIDFQVDRLLQFIHFAVSHSPFYAKLYETIDIDSIKTIDDLKKLPIVDKEMLRANIKDVITNVGNLEGHTGGTTGKSLVVKYSADDVMQRMAMLDNFKSRVGFEQNKMRRATFNGKHIVPPNQKKKVYWRYNAASKQMIYSSFHLTEENMGAYVDSLNKFKPVALDGFFTSLCDLAGYIKRHALPIKFHPIAIFPTSETLTQTGRELLENVFNCKVYDQYASSEGAPFVTECPNQMLHMELASGVFEHINDEDNEILITSFTTHGTPLIRYRIGDKMVFPSSKKCTCGLCGPIVEEIQGRRLDFLYTPEGAKINAGNVANLLKNIPNAVIRAQFIQKQMDEITVLLEVERELYKEEYRFLLLQEFSHKFGTNMKVHVEIVDEIPREASGKFLMIKNCVKETKTI